MIKKKSISCRNNSLALKKVTKRLFKPLSHLRKNLISSINNAKKISKKWNSLRKLFLLVNRAWRKIFSLQMDRLQTKGVLQSEELLSSLFFKKDHSTSRLTQLSILTNLERAKILLNLWKSQVQKKFQLRKSLRGSVRNISWKKNVWRTYKRF